MIARRDGTSSSCEKSTRLDLYTVFGREEVCFHFRAGSAPKSAAVERFRLARCRSISARRFNFCRPLSLFLSLFLVVFNSTQTHTHSLSFSSSPFAIHIAAIPLFSDSVMDQPFLSQNYHAAPSTITVYIFIYMCVSVNTRPFIAQTSPLAMKKGDL